MQKKMKPSSAEKMENDNPGWKKTTLLYMHDLVHILAFALIVFSLVFRLVVVSGYSMFETLTDGDYLFLLSNLFCSEPKRGDIIVASKQGFRNGELIVKRVIATEGQTVDIDFDAGLVYVDGMPLQEDYTNTPTNLEEGMEFPLTVEEDCVFAMGDNRNNSSDSRNPSIGQIKRREILGKALFLAIPGPDVTTEKRDFSRIGVIK